VTVEVQSVVLVLLLALGADRASAAEAVSWLGPDATKGSLVYADDDWLVWMSQELIPETRRHRAQSFTRKYRLQRVGQGETRLALTTFGTGASAVATVLADGTLGVSPGPTTLSWIEPQEQPATLDPARTVHLERDGKSYRIMPQTVGGSGLFLQRYDLNESHPVLFVPLDATELQWEHAVQVTDDAGVSVSTPPPALRAGDLAACGRFLTDLETGVRKALDIPAGWWIQAFDDAYAADLGGVIRLEDGSRTLREASYADHCIIAIHEGLAYGVRAAPRRAARFSAADVRGTGRVADLVVIEADGVVEPRHVHANVISCGSVVAFWNNKGCFVFDGRSWRHQPWLKALPD